MSATSHNFFGCCLRHCGLKHQRLSWGQDNKNGAHVCISCSAVSQKEHEIFLKSFRINRKIFLERSSMFDGVKWAVNLSERRSWPSLYLFHIWSAFLCVFLKKSSFFFSHSIVRISSLFLSGQEFHSVSVWQKMTGTLIVVVEGNTNNNCFSFPICTQNFLLCSLPPAVCILLLKPTHSHWNQFLLLWNGVSCHT